MFVYVLHTEDKQSRKGTGTTITSFNITKL